MSKPHDGITINVENVQSYIQSAHNNYKYA